MPTQKIIAIIPARGESKRLPRKNLAVLAGLPLVVHSIRHAIEADSVSEVYVSTDDDEIARISAEQGAEIVWRPAELAADTATSESALLHTLEHRRIEGRDDPDLVVFLQCTSPVRQAGDIDRAVQTLRTAGADSVISVAPNKRLFWRLENETPVPINYDPARRLREQDMAPQFEENGSIFVVRTELLRAEENRMGGKIAFYVMDSWSTCQIDEPEDLELVEWILTKRRLKGSAAAPGHIENEYPS